MGTQKVKRPAGKAGTGSGRGKTRAKQRAHNVRRKENAKAGLVNDPSTGQWRQPHGSEEEKKAVMQAAGARADKPAHLCRPRHGGKVAWTKK